MFLAHYPGKHRDLASISPSTLTEVLTRNNHNVLVVDSRYPYEYDGGHIVGAKNLYTQDQILDEFFVNKFPLKRVLPDNQIIIFHCEFSSHRAPNLMRFLRSQDRALNGEAYPALYYPEMYILEGGYKAFWEFCTLNNRETFCQPKSYRQMADRDFKDQLHFYRGETRIKKSRKRLQY